MKAEASSGLRSTSGLIRMKGAEVEAVEPLSRCQRKLARVMTAKRLYITLSKLLPVKKFIAVMTANWKEQVLMLALMSLKTPPLN